MNEVGNRLRNRECVIYFQIDAVTKCSLLVGLSFTSRKRAEAGRKPPSPREVNLVVETPQITTLNTRIMATSNQQTETTLIDDINRLYADYYRGAIGELAQNYPNDQSSLYVDWADVYKFDMELADDVCQRPEQVLEHFEEALRLFELPIDIDLDDATVRFYNLPDTRSYPVGAYRSRHISELIAVEGQVAKMTEVKPRPVVAKFECQRCGTVSTVPQDGIQWQEPYECQGCERQGPFKIMKAETEWQDIQAIRLQLPPEKTKGADSATIDCYLRDDIVDTIEAGDRVVVEGILDVEDPTDVDVGCTTKLQAKSVHVEETDYQDINVDEYIDEIKKVADGEYGDPYELLINSIAPGVHGMDEIKEALVLQMFGGVRGRGPDGKIKRGDPHVLLLGDPGTAKSTLLEDVNQKAPCSTFASGKGATAAGMTATATRDEFGGEQWTLEAGALVLADKGIACVDEIDKVKEEAVSSMHEALSKQTIHVQKAGISAHLPTRTALLAAGNPKHGRFIPEEPVADQIDLGPTMLSRFDLLFMIDDEPDPDEDAEIVEKMIEHRQQIVRYTDPSEDVDDEFEEIKPDVPTELLRAYVAFAKQHVYPRIKDEEVAEELKQSFVQLRLSNGTGEGKPVPVTFRKLEGIQRLAQASARVRLSDTVEMQDIDRARRLIGRSMTDVGMDPDSGQLDADIVETGTAKSQQERIQWVKQFIESNQGTDPVAIEDVIEAAKAQMGEEQAEYCIEKLKAKGELYEPESDHLRTT